MKQKLKNCLKKWGGVIALFPLIMGCSPENEFIEQEHYHQNIRKISFNEFSQNTLALESLRRVERKDDNGISLKVVYDSNNNFYINTDKIIIAEEGGRKFFTFPILRDSITSLTENLVLSENASGHFIPYIFQYSLSDDDKAMLNASEHIDNLQSKTKIYRLDNFDLDLVVGKFTTINCTYTLTTSCSANLHPNGMNGGAQCDGFTQVMTNFNCDGGGSGGANTDPGNYTPPSNPNPTVPNQGGQNGWGSTGGQTPNYYIVTVPLVEDWTTAQNNFIKGLPLQHRQWLLNSQNVTFKNNVLGYLIMNQFSEESRDFAEEGIIALQQNGEVDFLYHVIKDPSFKNNPCLNGVYAQLGNAPTFQNYLQNFDGSFSVANLKFKASSLTSTTNAETSAPANYLITINFNTNNLNRPALDIARTFIHELIHAEMYRKLMSLAGRPNIAFTPALIQSMRNNYPGLYDYYMRFKFNVSSGQAISDAQHEMMAQHYRGIIVEALRQFDNNSQPDSVYQALSWIGLMGSGQANELTGLTPNPTVAWSNLPPAQRLQIISTYTNFYNSNSQCQ